ncbi:MULTISPECIES: hypothetical protein [Streptomyces]|uniref:hypothetical protein n=1 Tax=Streptomyces TaxID=1883 RepID=UPI00345BB8DC
MHRRTFIAASTGTVLSATSLVGAARPTVGTADVQRLRNALTALWLLDDQEGGGPALEGRAVALGRETLRLQQNGSASQRIRNRLYGLGAAFTAIAMWATINARLLDRAQRHMESAIALAGLSGDGRVQHEIWRYATALAAHRGRWHDAVAAAEAAMGTSAHRRDPLHASLSHARLALYLPNAGNCSRALRALERAADAFDRADLHAHRPASMGFFTRSELEGLAGIALLRLGRPAQAECHIHRCLATLRPEQRRNRALYTAHVALAQLHQGDVEQACTTATQVLPSPGSTPVGAVQHLLSTFTTELNRRAAGAKRTHSWNEHVRGL